MPEQKTGQVHSVESFGTVDGPGTRLVVFLQGCPMRCQYCHNPDTWKPVGGTPMTVEQLLAQYERNEPFYKNGGITVSGGEPLLQIDFVTSLFTEAKKRGIHTCVDTSGITFRADSAAVREQFDTLCAVTDLVMLDIKHAEREAHKKLTGQDNRNILDFARYLADKKVPMWVRHVVVPGITDSQEEWQELGTLLAQFDNLCALDVLPYHTMGVNKYASLGIPYPLEGVPALNASVAKQARNAILKARKAALAQKVTSES